MEFSEIILNTLGPLFSKYALTVAEKYENAIILKSTEVTIGLFYDQRENVASLYAQYNGDEEILISDDVIETVFKIDPYQIFKIPPASHEDFARNIEIFLKGPGGGLLYGDSILYERLREFADEKSKKYTEDLINRQWLRQADTEWEEKNYSGFVKSIANLDINKLPESYKLKYKYALKKTIK